MNDIKENNCMCCICNKLSNLTRKVNQIANCGTTTVSAGTTTTLAPGASATVINAGTPTDAVFNFGIPAGVAGPSGAPGINGVSATVTVGTTTTLAPGSLATVTNTGTALASILNFGIPQGQSGTTGNSVYSSFLGALLNDGDLPSLVLSGARIPWKVNNNNETGLIKPSADNSYFQFTQTGRYLCIFTLRCSVKTAADNGVVSWGLYALSILKEMITSASSFVTPNMASISGVGIISVTNLAELYNFVNNSMVTINVQGATKAQTFNDGFYSTNGVNVVDGMNVVFVRLGVVPNSAI